jgi:hypothetical protein
MAGVPHVTVWGAGTVHLGHPFAPVPYPACKSVADRDAKDVHYITTEKPVNCAACLRGE